MGIVGFQDAPSLREHLDLVVAMLPARVDMS